MSVNPDSPRSAAPLRARILPSGMSRRALAIFVLLLLVIVVSRMIRLRPLEMEPDEVWSVWQTFGTPGQIVGWTPYDWPPLYYLLLGGWRAFVGSQPITGHFSSLLPFLIGTAFLYRSIRRLYDERAAVLTTLAYGAMGYLVFLGTRQRGYALILSLMPIAFWLTLRYFDHPSVRRAIPLAICMAAMFYTYLTSVVAFAMLGVYTLIVYRRQIWRWWLPGIGAALLALPEILAKQQLASGRVQAIGTLKMPAFGQGLLDIVQFQTGYSFALWAVLFAVATVLIAYRRRPLQRPTWALLAWVVTVPILLYVSNPILNFFSGHYGLWIAVTIALWVGLGLSALPRPGLVGASVLLAALMFVPLPLGTYYIAAPMPFAQNFAWLAQKAKWGDVILIDPNWHDRVCNCIRAEEWDYFIHLYFPNGLQFVSSPQGYRRVWYVKWDSLQDKAVEQQVAQGRLASEFVGPPEFLIRLYESPPDEKGILYENGMRFHGVEIIGTGDSPDDISAGRSTYPIVASAPGTLPGAAEIAARREGQRVLVRLWWSVDRPIDQDYSVGTQVIDDHTGTLTTQFDGPPQVTDAPQQTSQWTPGRYYVEERDLLLPYPTNDGTYTIFQVVYFWQINKRMAAPGVNSDNLLPIQRFTVKAW